MMAAGRKKQICSTDRISELPEHLLHHILCFLSQKQAVQTCVLSKSWRFLGSTRPKLEFHYQDYGYQKLIPILDKSLHRYRDQKLCVQEFRVEFHFFTDPETAVVFLKEWSPFIVATMRAVKTFDLSFGLPGIRFDLPAELFENSKSLRNLRLCGFRFSQNLPMDKVHHLKHLQTLALEDVHIVDETFQNIMSCCRYIEHLVLRRCEGLTTIRLMNNYLKGFDLFYFYEHRLKEDLCFVDAPNLESMRIETGGNWFFFDRHHRKKDFPALKSLELWSLRLQNALLSLDILSCDFPCLQHFYIHDCSGFSQLRVLNHSIKKLTISRLDDSIKVVVDAPNIEALNFNRSIPMDISFTTTSNECVSHIKPGWLDEDGFLKLSGMLKAVSQSKITLELFRDERYELFDFGDDNQEENSCGGYDDKPALVEYVHLEKDDHEYFYSAAFINRMFRFCRPRNILEEEYDTWNSEFLCKMFLFRQNKAGFSDYYWQRDLEEASMQVRDHNSGEWLSVEGTTFLESANYKGEVWFKLNWRE